MVSGMLPLQVLVCWLPTSQVALISAGPLTAFPQTNAAFADLLGALRNTKTQRMTNRASFIKILTYHAV